MKDPAIYVAITTYKHVLHLDILTTLIEATKNNVIRHFNSVSVSNWISQLNKLWLHALSLRKDGITHFLNLHADVVVRSPGWVDTMLEEMKELDVDILSAVCRTKILESTAISTIDNNKDNKRRMSLEDVPFGTSQASTDLLVNNGCLLVDITKPWVDEIYWRMDHDIRNDVPFCESEDWIFCKDAKNLGCKIGATNKIKTEHWGLISFNSYPLETL